MPIYEVHYVTTDGYQRVVRRAAGDKHAAKRSVARESGVAYVTEAESMPLSNRPRYLTTSEAAVWLAVSPKTVCRWAAEGKLEFIATVGGHRRFDENFIAQLADRLRSPSVGL